MPSRHKLFMSTIFANRKNNHTDKKQRFPICFGNRCFLSLFFAFTQESQLQTEAESANSGKNSVQSLLKPCKKIKIFRSCVLVAYLRATFAAFRGIGERGIF